MTPRPRSRPPSRSVDDGVPRRASSAAAGAIEDFHRRQVPQSWFTTQEGGVFLGQKVTPLRRVGIYVPGGRARYPSSVLMNAIPAIVAGVDEIAMVVPPAADGTVNPYTLAAAAEAGVDRDLQGRRRAGGRRARVRHRHHPARRQDRRPGQRVRHRRQEARHGRRRHRHARRPLRGARARRRDRRARVRRHRPDGAGRARPARRDLPRHDRPRRCPTQVEEALEVLLEESPRGEITARSLDRQRPRRRRAPTSSRRSTPPT